MGSKKHKKESKKRKHRSRSRSPLDGEERERKRHRKHKDRKKDRSPDVEEVPVDSHLEREAEPSPAPSSSSSARRHEGRDKSQESERDSSPTPASGSAQESLSIEETNKLRAKLGLKPLEVPEKPADDGKFKDDLGEFYHVPASNIAAQKKADKLREKLAERRDKRDIDNKLQTSLLAEGSDDEDASAWVRKTRDMEKQKQEAAKRAALLDEMDEVFGVGALVADDQHRDRQEAYHQEHLKGLRVAHTLDALPEERETVLTLADKEVLADDDEDVLVNVNIVDDEKYKKNIEERKKARTGYQAYDEEADIQAALGYSRPVLAKYDDEIEPSKGDKTRGFFIGDEDALMEQKLKDMMRAELIAGGPDKVLESLQSTGLRPASDYLQPDELQARFKKVKKKGKIRKKAKQEPIDVEEHEAGSVPLDTDDTEISQEVTAPVLDEDEVEVDTELQAALHRARRLRQGGDQHRTPKLEEILQQIKEEKTEESQEAGGSMVLDATAEFCRTLGDIPTYGLAGNREHTAEIMDFDREEAEPEPESGASGGAWSRVDVRTDRPADLEHEGASGAGLEAEPALGAGVAGALRLALSKGYLERDGALPAPRPTRSSLAALAALHYSIEDKTYGEDDKYGRRERGGHSGPLSEFREKSDFRPDIKLEYVDDDGRPLCPKEAFRYLSHKFHGKGPGKNKQEKRIKKAVQEGLMKKMSSTDTPLNTLQMLQQKQRETQSPFVVLSGAKRDAPN
ncbi:U4/U6.U5 tri-snRNP-associated protein 1 [Danaus plexippus]|uniref:U4/U6.U5 tri-snRNP-associated protein 1 n=1 Tax=Danaus plexippus plexippus TaxID=278856 RepID=A0A212F665_DANPL|nr:U4/U6.U5 tri-snRNP-associated protein 1 [Danaus plexippus]OWR49232.1 U4/U6.U5 tri-snRNP-associated protein 1 [Danaus plexippus plexippus]